MIVFELIILAGSLVAVLAGIGLLRFSTPFARFHAAGKASPVAFIVSAIGASFILGWAGAALLLTASFAMVLTCHWESTCSFEPPTVLGTRT